MAGDWMKIELELPDKPEVHYMAGVLNLDSDAVVGKLIRVWQWFNKHTIDGNAHGVTFSLPDRISGVTGFGEAMFLAGWLEQNDKTLTMPKFDRHTSESAKARALTAKRVAKSKAKSNANGNGVGVSEALPREEKRREDIKTIETLSGKPDAADAVNKKLNGSKATAEELLEFLNAKAGKGYRPVLANLEPIVSRLKEGFSAQDIKTVIARKCRDWGADDKMREYLRPATLFNRTKFAQYHGECVEA